MIAPKRIWATAYYSQNRSEHVREWSTTPYEERQDQQYVCANLHDATKAQLAMAVEALQYYADKEAYETQYERLPCDCCTDIFEPINEDKGEKARAVLADIEKGEPK